MKALDRLVQNTPDAAAFARMIDAGFDAEAFEAFRIITAHENAHNVTFCNVFPDHKGDYKRDEMQALNKRLRGELAIYEMSLALDGTVSHFEVAKSERVLAIIAGAAHVAASAADGAA